MTIARTAAPDLILAFVAQTSRFLARLIFGAFVLVWISAASMANDTPATDLEMMSIIVGETELSFPKTQKGFPVLVSYDFAGVPNSHRSFPFTIPPPEANILAKMVAEYYSKLTASLATGQNFGGANFRIYSEGLFPDPGQVFFPDPYIGSQISPVTVRLSASPLTPEARADYAKRKAGTAKWLAEVILPKEPDEFGLVAFPFSEARNWGQDYGGMRYRSGINFVAVNAADRTPFGEPAMFDDHCEPPAPPLPPNKFRTCVIGMTWREGLNTRIDFFADKLPKKLWLPMVRRVFSAITYLERPK